MKSHIPSFAVAVKESAAVLNSLASVKDVEATYARLYKTLKSLWEAQANCLDYRKKTLVQALNQIPLLAAACKRGRKDFCVDTETIPVDMKNYDSMAHEFANIINRRNNYPWLENTLDDDYDDLKVLYEKWRQDSLDLGLIEHVISDADHYGALVYRAMESHRAKFQKKAA